MALLGLGRGSERIGAFFGPVMAIWFIMLAASGLVQVLQQPAVLAALNPAHALRFLFGHGWIGFLGLRFGVPGDDGRRGVYTPTWGISGARQSGSTPCRRWPAAPW